MNSAASTDPRLIATVCSPGHPRFAYEVCDTRAEAEAALERLKAELLPIDADWPRVPTIRPYAEVKGQRWADGSLIYEE